MKELNLNVCTDGAENMSSSTTLRSKINVLSLLLQRLMRANRRFKHDDNEHEAIHLFLCEDIAIFDRYGDRKLTTLSCLLDENDLLTLFIEEMMLHWR